MQPQLYTDDICARKHRGSSTSIAANTRANKTKARDKMRIMEFAIKKGGRVYLKLVERELGMLRNTVSAWLSDLLKAGSLERTDERQEGCGVLKLVIK